LQTCVAIFQRKTARDGDVKTRQLELRKNEASKPGSFSD
jgi:hypothetical protein